MWVYAHHRGFLYRVRRKSERREGWRDRVPTITPGPHLRWKISTLFLLRLYSVSPGVSPSLNGFQCVIKPWSDVYVSEVPITTLGTKMVIVVLIDPSKCSV